MQFDSTTIFVLVLVFGGVFLNIIVSTGALVHLVKFSNEFGKLQQEVATTSEEVASLRKFRYDLVEGRIHISPNQGVPLDRQ